MYAKIPFFKPEFACPVRNIFTDFLRGNKFRFSNGVQYLGRYTHKIAISNHRIRNIDYAKKTVTFSAKNYRKGAQKHDITLKTSDFIKRFALHILPKGFTRIRHFGILSSSWKKIKLPELQQLVNEQNTTEIIKEKPTLHRRCPTCKKGKLVTVLLFDGRGPPKNWRENLKAIKSIT